MIAFAPVYCLQEPRAGFGTGAPDLIVYHSTKAGFLDDAHSQEIEDVVLRAYRTRTGRSVAPNEIRSWKESLAAMARVLHKSDIADDVGVAIEYGIPQCAKRIDFILAGRDDEERDNVVIVELKQWETASRTDKDGVVSTVVGGGVHEVSHPSYQAWSYASLLRNFNQAVYESELALRPCAYLHNYSGSHDLWDPFYGEYLAEAPVFLKGESEKDRLREFLRKHVRFGDASSTIQRIERGVIRPSKGLADSVAGLLAGNREFILIDDQKVVYETILARARESIGKGPKQVIIVEGGPGTGKSVVAINLLVELMQRGLFAKYVSKNSAPRVVYERMLAGTRKKSAISNLFDGSGSFTETGANAFGTLLVDEAHRLSEKSGLYGNLGHNQVEELIHSTKCAVFFIDEDQAVTWKDVGRKADIAKRARRVGARVTPLKLESQFRCNGSDGYVAWLDNVLEIRETANTTLDGIDFDFQVFDSPESLRLEIEKRNRVANKARMVAGYCWDWKSKKSPAELDVVIPEHRFAMQWNLTQDGGLWIMAPDSVRQIGCIHTCQGLEVDYIGVVIGPDLVCRDGRIVTVPEGRSRMDQSLKGYKKLLVAKPAEARAKADRIIRNTYRTLMTRGMKGCFVYCVDAALGNQLRGTMIARSP